MTLWGWLTNREEDKPGINTDAFTLLPCATCGLPFAVLKEWATVKVGQQVWCPNGHIGVLSPKKEK